MKNFKIAALPLAIAGIFASSAAFAGTEACFEVYKTTADIAGVVTNHDVLYTPASCEATRVGATDTTLEAIVNTSVAWELTGDIDLDLEATGAVTPRSLIVYIPTTDVPPASRITMQLTGADFGTDNANQIYLVSKDLATGDYQTVASSDGAFNDTTTVEFLTKAGVTIGAGSRLLLSQTNPEGVAEDGTLIEAISVHVANTETCTINPEVTIKAISAFTDAGTVIAGGKSSATGATAILDISEQFTLVANPQDTNEILVDAEDPSFRQQFVVSKLAGAWVGQVIATDGAINTSAFWETEFTNSFDDLDLAVTLDADDEVMVGVSADSSTGDGVTLSFLANIGAGANSLVGGTTGLDADQDDHIAVTALDDVQLVDFDDNVSDLLPLTETPVTYTMDASEVFPSDATSDVFVSARLMNADAEIMEFNYNVNTTWSMDFNEAGLLNKNGCETPTPFNVGVNGAVLKVPYAYTKINEGGFVRITSEHTSEATIFMDIFDEASHETKNVNLGQIAPKASNVLKTDDLLAAAAAAGYVGTGDRHTMTFTVTAPKNKVHGVSVQKIAGGVDRVMPVLDQNDWSQ